MTSKKQFIKFNSVLFQNIISLGALQFLNYVIPFITFPYIVRVLGPGKFGLINFAGAFTGYFALLTDYGFNLSATREISINRDDKNKIDQIVASIFTVKIILFFAGAGVFLVLVYSLEIFNSDPAVYLLSFLYVVGGLLIPYWFFLGIEKMRLITIPTLIVRSIVTVLIFIFVTEEKDYLLYIILSGTGMVVIGIISIAAMRFIIGVKFAVPAWEDIVHEFKEGGLIFLSMCSISLYTLSGTFILGLFAPLHIVGYYSAADKIKTAVQNLFMPVTQATYPHLSRLFNESKAAGIKFVKRILKTAGSLSFGVSVILLVLAEPIIVFVLGEKYAGAASVLRIISFLPFIIFLSNLFGIQTMLNLGRKKEFTIIIVSAGVLNLILAFSLVPVYLAVGTSVSVLITEIFVTVGMIIFIRKEFFHTEKLRQ